MKPKLVTVVAALAVLAPGSASATEPADTEIGGPCAGKDYVVIVTNPINGERIKVCFNRPGGVGWG